MNLNDSEGVAAANPSFFPYKTVRILSYKPMDESTIFLYFICRQVIAKHIAIAYVYKNI